MCIRDRFNSLMILSYIFCKIKRFPFFEIFQCLSCQWQNSVNTFARLDFSTVMQSFLSVWVQFLLIHIGLSDTGSLLKHGYTQIVYGHLLDGKTISSFAPVTFLDCVEECLVRNRCQSVSYFKGANYCEIKFKDKLTAASSYQEQAGWVYSEKGHWPPVKITYVFEIFI